MTTLCKAKCSEMVKVHIIQDEAASEIQVVKMSMNAVNSRAVSTIALY
jgi:hypothetical protein